MKNNNNITNMILKSVLAGICVGALLSVPLVVLAIQFSLSLPLCIFTPVVLFGTIVPLSLGSAVL